MSRISSVTQCILAGKDGWKLTGQWFSFITKVKDAVYTRWYLRAAFYALIIAAVFVTWLALDGDSVAFVYSEF